MLELFCINLRKSPYIASLSQIFYVLFLLLMGVDIYKASFIYAGDYFMFLLIFSVNVVNTTNQFSNIKPMQHY